MINWENHITTDSEVLLGKPIIKNTRISIEFILERLASGWTSDQLLENYPRLTSKDITAVYSYAYECMKDGLLIIKGKRA
ncbi:DUF433 domain-containing protein [Saprospiraceae bacterium]|nr:DUF433 domain-containing protein [Saprospiraceae bacterium]